MLKYFPIAMILLLAAPAAIAARSPVTEPAPTPASVSAAPGAPVTLEAVPIALPGGGAAIGFDDLGFAPSLNKVLVPGGRTGNLFLIDPATHEVSAAGGFSVKEASGGGHGEGITSVDFGRGLLFVVDRTALRLDVMDPASNKIVASAALSSGPDYVRYVEKTNEIWVTEPGDDRIEIFKLPDSTPPTPTKSGFIKVPGGPESLVIDASRGLAYANLWEGATVAIDLRSHSFTAHWTNGCTGSRGLALDTKRGFLFVGCAEGKASALDVDHGGAILDTLAHGSGVDIIAYDAALSHLYLPGGKSATMALLGVSASGKLSLLATAKTAGGSHCVVVDDRHQAWVCDPPGGRLLLVADNLPATH